MLAIVIATRGSCGDEPIKKAPRFDLSYLWLGRLRENAVSTSCGEEQSVIFISCSEFCRQ